MRIILTRRAHAAALLHDVRGLMSRGEQIRRIAAWSASLHPGQQY